MRLPKEPLFADPPSAKHDDKERWLRIPFSRHQLGFTFAPRNCLRPPLVVIITVIVITVIAITVITITLVVNVLVTIRLSSSVSYRPSRNAPKIIGSPDLV